MNLHEECLLKYLANPLKLHATTELLKLSNAMLIKECFENEKKYNTSKINSSICWK